MKKKYGADRIWPFAEGSGASLLAATGALVVAWLIWFWTSHLLALGLLILIGFLWLAVLWFFRDPNRQPVTEPGLVVAPGDGQVVAIEQEQETRFLQTPAWRISIFLDVYNVHVQRIPFSGRVVQVVHTPGQFRQAFRPEASEVNEHISMLVDAGPAGRYLVKQIAGIMARRCVNYLQPGDVVQTGQRFGLIRFGSRVDLFLPVEAHIVAQVGQSVFGGRTPLAHLPPGPPRHAEQPLPLPDPQ